METTNITFAIVATWVGMKAQGYYDDVGVRCFSESKTLCISFLLFVLKSQ